MVDILHSVGIQGATPDRVYEALTTTEGLAGWWTTDTTGEADSPGGVILFRFPPGGFDMEVVRLDHGKRVTWRVVEGPEEWIDTTIDWELSQHEDYTIVSFSHQGWREPVPFMHHCSTKWATFLISLKSLVETGTGAPSPRDVRITFWD
ncbi:Activator of Hsp90 ATPase 1 family protein [metagenome]|uniref:Activator of Hsp90 ATPase 1 family protein n=1 Tax=metagenome TaxID=256318 RepID=A0A2P2C9P8_9ZZZZ